MGGKKVSISELREQLEQLVEETETIQVTEIKHAVQERRGGQLADLNEEVDAIFEAIRKEKEAEKRAKIRRATSGAGGEQVMQMGKRARLNDMSGSLLAQPDGSVQPKKPKAKKSMKPGVSSWNKLLTDAWECYRQPASRKEAGVLLAEILEPLPNAMVSFGTQASLLTGVLNILITKDAPLEVAILALHPLIRLMTENRVDSAIFQHTYRLLTPSAVASEQGPSLLRVARVLVLSAQISNKMAASFTKKLLQIALQVPLAPCRECVAIAVAALTRHGRTRAALLSGPETNQPDPFKADEPDPEKTEADKSSLYELQTLLRHYDPDIRRHALVLAEGRVPATTRDTVTSLFGGLPEDAGAVSEAPVSDEVWGEADDLFGL
ncbi:CBF/Mak21 family [Carpediemonas membranifera]|uniref:CBF/Mak21 family n=1 Tax=Carpediemonas membranifera TaxID=201153 RepID=A0A8J6E180_9EUKA|nr:CBF/Mak21 family [Carpediemonas membranifera]|eukprot:KAG9390292.1 CBF/Mak21 family [Carpediemonas membranifera]